MLANHLRLIGAWVIVTLSVSIGLRHARAESSFVDEHVKKI
jgi:hypothetical protein